MSTKKNGLSTSNPKFICLLHIDFRVAIIFIGGDIGVA